MSESKPEDILWEGKIPECPAPIEMKIWEIWSFPNYSNCYSGICAEVHMTAFLKSEIENLNYQLKEVDTIPID